MVAQIGFSICFSGHLCVSSSHVRNLEISKTCLTLRNIFQKKAHEWLLPSSDFVHAYTVNKMCSSWYRSQFNKIENHGSELKFFVSIFAKLNEINNIKSSKVATFENCDVFSSYYFSYVRDYKATLLGGNNIIFLQKHV